MKRYEIIAEAQVLMLDGERTDRYLRVWRDGDWYTTSAVHYAGRRHDCTDHARRVPWGGVHMSAAAALHEAEALVVDLEREILECGCRN